MDEGSNTIINPLGTDPASLFMQFQMAMASKQPVPQEVLQWLIDGLRLWVERGGKEDLARTLGLRDALKELAKVDRLDRDQELLFQMDMLVALGVRSEDVPALVAESLELNEALSESKLRYMFNTKRVRASADLIRMRLAGYGGEKRFLSRFTETYMPPALLSMMRRP